MIPCSHRMHGRGRISSSGLRAATCKGINIMGFETATDEDHQLPLRDKQMIMAILLTPAWHASSEDQSWLGWKTKTRRTGTTGTVKMFVFHRVDDTT
jgi:hypothetical protein